MTALIRATSLTGFPELVRDLGGDPDPLLRQMGIDPALLDNGAAVIPYRSMINLLELCAERLNCVDFGLRLAERQSITILGPLAVVGQNARNVGEALAAITRFLDTYSPGVLVYLDSDLDPARPHLIYELRLRPLPRQTQIIELSLGVMFKTLQMLYGPGFKPHAVLSRTEARLPQQRYQRFFGARMHFGQACTGLVLLPEHLSKPIDQHNRQLHDTMMEYVSSLGAAKPLEIHVQVEDAIRRLLPTQRCALPLIAEQLGMRERSLQRRLAEHDQVFEDMVDGVRRELADLYLAEAQMPMAQVAGLLGYAEQSSFNRACRRWYGTPPRERRAQLRAAAAAQAQS
ncbi:MULTISPECIES: AraC family transcriptional regulator [Pseudomonas]|uniref:AraC family transcriptional regulator n=1 Tax=Pseudomonas TaxID=286 RepID=UPI0006D42D1A|nr:MULTISPECIES: AraC family transcriptional regulator [Pseudomonas]MCE4070841.1 AraC family transcriptional regulator [Pseudomonas nitritireducens]MCE4080289.1 AraC family transcriptional regulator [Pseudomonas nitroreducens]OBY88288.1 AraC family transcriptional regulator [Pseudomonas sp. AU11447]